MRLEMLLLVFGICSISLVCCDKSSKYSKKANLPESEVSSDFRNLQKPFRMAKLNLVWSKAVHKLTEPKLKSLYTELKIQDKEELAWKQLNSQHQDKDGLKEASLRKKLIGIMSTYGLLEFFDDTQDPEKYKHHKGLTGQSSDRYRNKSLFKDKKLNKLWEKAEISGFLPDELAALKEEFQHHDEKVDMYYKLIEDLHDTNDNKKDRHENEVDEDSDRFNEITFAEETNDIVEQQKRQMNKNSEYMDKSNMVRLKHREIRDNYDRLERIASKGPNSTDFIEPKVQGLWRIATASNFSADELSSLKIELLHYESRLLKLRQMHSEHALTLEKFKNADYGDKKIDKLNSLEENIKKQSRKVEKIQETIEKRIFREHTEL